MNKYSPFWVVPYISNNIDIKLYKNWIFFSSLEVIEGISPLNDKGEDFYNILRREVSLYDNCLWIFNDSKFEEEEYAKLNIILKNSLETYLYSFISRPGIIIFYKNGGFTEQPPSFENFTTGVVENVTNEKIKRILKITDFIYQRELNHYLEIFEYLREIKKSKTFIRELALWSFVEQHWKSKEGEYIEKSLKNMKAFIFGEDYRNEFRRSFDENLKKFNFSISNKKGNVGEIRNSLAHGSFFKNKKNWNEDDWDLFFNIHNKLFDMILLGIEKEIFEVVN
ncbi:hypothetical protein [Tenacibaculum halocynthiae]|uniref:hypothetical protein n=1 Tax=Tenacibaculum halocynthiae TaxID=1254437 RepID=UPI003D651381